MKVSELNPYDIVLAGVAEEELRRERIRQKVNGFYRRMESTDSSDQAWAETQRDKRTLDAKPKRKRRKMTGVHPPLEKDERTKLKLWLKANSINFDINIEGAYRPDMRSRVYAKMEGMTRGRPDFQITTPVPGHPDIRGIAIELKRQKGKAARVTDEQKARLEQLRGDGHFAAVCYGADDAIATLKMLGFGK
jgi:hypothetical protein